MVISKIERLQKEMDRAIIEGDLDLALAVTDDMVKQDPKVSKHHVSKGVIMAKLGDTDGAIEELDIALEIDDQDDKAWYSKGCVLMDDGRTRPALACFYKSLDIDPSQNRVRDRFTRCLDHMMRVETEEEPESEEVYFEGPKLISEDRKDFIPDHDEEQEDEEEEEPEILIRKKKDGSYLDEDLFDDEEDEDDDDEDLEEVEDWGDDDDEEDDDEPDWVDEDDEEEEPASSIKCRCGETIEIHSDDRPYRFKCHGCGRTGTLK